MYYVTVIRYPAYPRINRISLTLYDTVQVRFINLMHMHFYAPNFEEIDGAYCFGLFVRPSVRASFCLYVTLSDAYHIL